MVDSIVSVRMPSALVQKLRELAKENHFLDISEEVRSIVKHKIRQQKIQLGEKPEKKISAPDYQAKNKMKKELINRLKQMIEELENE